MRGGFLDHKRLALFAVFFFISFALYFSGVPGLNGEEASDAMALEEILHGQDAPPLAYNGYSGSGRLWTILPLYAVLGQNTRALRLAVSLQTLGLLGLIFLFFRKTLDSRAACRIVTVCALNGVFLQNGRLSFFHEYVVLMLCLWLGLYCLLRFAEDGTYSWLVYSGACFGFGLHTKINFIWYLAGMTIYALLCERKRLRTFADARHCAPLLGGFLTGLSPAILYNVQSGGATLKLLFHAAKNGRTFAGVDNSDILTNSAVRIGQILRTLSGDLKSISNIWSCLPESSFTILGTTAMLGLMLTALYATGRKAKTSAPILFCHTMLWTAAAGLPLTVSTLDPSHTFLLFPFPAVLLGLYLYRLEAGREKQGTRTLAGFLLVFIVVYGTAVNVRRATTLDALKGCVSNWSDAPARLVDYMQERRIRRLYASNWEIHKTVEYLSGGSILPDWYNPNERGNVVFNLRTEKEAFIRSLRRHARHPGATYFVWNAEDDAGFGEPFLTEAARREGRTLRVETRFSNTKGRLLLTLYRLNPS